jgi:hypothetical protein
MLKANSTNFHPVPTIDQRFQKEPQYMNYKNINPSGLNTMSIPMGKNGMLDYLQRDLKFS